jgi:hypothetical protein
LKAEHIVDSSPESASGKSVSHLGNCWSCGLTSSLSTSLASVCSPAKPQRGHEWLKRQCKSGKYERLGRSLAVEVE